MRKFFTRKGDAPMRTLFTRIRKRNPNIDILVSTELEVDAVKWDKANESLNAWNKYASTQEGRFVIPILQEIDEALSAVERSGSFDKEAIKSTVHSIRYKEEIETARKQEEEARLVREYEERERERLAEEERNDVLLYLKRRIEGMRSGEVKHKGEDYEPGSCKMWSSFYLVLSKFHEQNPFSWADIDRRLTDRFLFFLDKEGYMAKTANKYLSIFRSLVNYAYEDGMHTNALAMTRFTKRRVQESDKCKEIYLTADELQALYEMPLTDTRALYRDVFLVGCYTCQRFSDYSSIQKEHFTTTAKGTKVIRLEQQKTGNAIVIPILSDNLMTIAERYGFNIPKCSDVVMNRYIKEILKDLSETVPSLARKEVTLLTMKERELESKAQENGKELFERDEKGRVIKPRYALVCTHTARRSGITNLYLTGKFDTLQMMSISGHKDAKTFKDYIKLSSDEIADAIAEKSKESGSNISMF